MPRLLYGIFSKALLQSFINPNLLLFPSGFLFPQSCTLLSCFPPLPQYLLPWLSISHLLRWTISQFSSVASFPLLFLVGKGIQRCMNPPAIVLVDIWSSNIYREILFLFFLECLSMLSLNFCWELEVKSSNSTLYSPSPEYLWNDNPIMKLEKELSQFKVLPVSGGAKPSDCIHRPFKSTVCCSHPSVK